MRRHLIPLALASILLATPARAFVADWITDTRIEQALTNAKLVWHETPHLDAFAMEELVAEIASKAYGLTCQPVANRFDPQRDIVCSTLRVGRPIQLQVKSGTSVTTAGKICTALATGRYNGVRIVLADDTYIKVAGRCAALLGLYERVGMLEKVGIPTARVRSVYEGMLRVPVVRRWLRWVPYVGSAIVVGTIAWEVYENDDASLDVDNRIKKATSIVGRETSILGLSSLWGWGAYALTAAAIPTAPAAASVVVGAAVGVGIGYAISASGAGEFIGERTGQMASSAWGWVSR